MGLFGKKKDKKAEAKAEKKEEPKPTAGSTIEFDADGKPIKAEWARSSKVELDEVETAIDLKARAESRQNVLKMYEEKYGEKLDAPEFSAGLQYEYQLYEDGTYSSKRDLKDVEKAAKAGTEGAAPTEGATKTEGATTDAGTKTEGTVEATGTKTEGTETVKTQAPEKPAAPSFFDPDKKIDWLKSSGYCILLGKPMFPIARIVEYKARKPETWMKALIIVDIVTIVEPLSMLFWRLWTRIGYEVYTRMKQSKAKKTEDEAKAKEAKEAKKAEKASKA